MSTESENAVSIADRLLTEEAVELEQDAGEESALTSLREMVETVEHANQIRRSGGRPPLRMRRIGIKVISAEAATDPIVQGREQVQRRTSRTLPRMVETILAVGVLLGLWSLYPAGFYLTLAATLLVEAVLLRNLVFILAVHSHHHRST